MESNELIRRLAGGAAPVRRLRAPWRRSVSWLLVSLSYVAAVVAVSLFGSVSLVSIDLRLVVEQVAILATAITAAIAAFSLTVPGRDCRIAFVPLVPLAIWLSSLGEGCVSDWLRLGADGLKLRADWDCALAALNLSIVPVAMMVAMLRRGAPLMPRLSVALGALAVAALVNFGLPIFHAGDISIMVLVWHVGFAAMLTMIAGQMGNAVLKWRTLANRDLAIIPDVS